MTVLTVVLGRSEETKNAISKLDRHLLELGGGVNVQAKILENDHAVETALLEASLYSKFQVTLYDPMTLVNNENTERINEQAGRLHIAAFTTSGRRKINKTFDLARVKIPTEKAISVGDTQGTLGRVAVLQLTSYIGQSQDVVAKFIPFSPHLS